MISIQLLDYKYTLGSLDFSKSVIGDLDVGSSEDFPLALTLSVAEVRDLNARTGTYSKTFKIPATKNNNKILKSSYYEGSTISDNTIANKKPCRIIVDNAYEVTGSLQVTAIGSSTKPLFYSCVFYGNNVDWASSINNKRLKDLSVNSVEDGSGWDSLNGKSTGIGLKADRDSIIATWDVDNAVHKTPIGGAQVASDIPIVYPIVGYGENNEGGAVGRLQLLKTKCEFSGGSASLIGYSGWDSQSTPVEYPTPIPSMDWRPAIFIYDIIKQLFTQEGYSIVSNFIDSDLFKGITMLLPNFRYNNVDERISANSAYVSFNGSGYAQERGLSRTSNWNQDYWTSSVIQWNNGSKMDIIDEGSMYSDASGHFTIKEYGFYDINASGLGGWLDSICGGTDAPMDVHEVGYIRIRCEVQTAGETEWVILGTMDGFPLTVYPYSEPCADPPGCTECLPPPADKSFNFESLLIENQWLNKNDKIRFIATKKSRWFDAGDFTPKTQIWDLSIWGGSGATGYTSASTSGANGLINIIHKGEVVEYGQTFDLKNVIDSDSTQLGFLQGLIHAFNLQFTTDTVSKIVYIEPFNDFFKPQNVAVDWTDKIDFSKSQESKWIQSDLKREMIFKYKTDSNDKVVENRGNTYWDGIIDEFPYREFLSNEFEVGKSIFENPFFAGSYNSQDGQTYAGSASTNQTPYRANLWGLCDTGAIPTGGSACRPPKGYEFVPRLVNYVKMDSRGVSSIVLFAAATQVWADTDIISIIPGWTYDPSIVTPILARACSVDGYTDSVYPRQPLTYASVNQGSFNWSANSIGAEVPYRGLYQTYYQKMIEQVISNPRIRIAHLNLKLSDINNLDLRKLVYIDGYYYRINRIIDYRPNNNEVTKVELVLWEEKGYLAIDTTFNS